MIYFMIPCSASVPFFWPFMISSSHIELDSKDTKLKLDSTVTTYITLAKSTFSMAHLFIILSKDIMFSFFLCWQWLTTQWKNIPSLRVNMNPAQLKLVDNHLCDISHRGSSLLGERSQISQTQPDCDSLSGLWQYQSHTLWATQQYAQLFIWHRQHKYFIYTCSFVILLHHLFLTLPPLT